MSHDETLANRVRQALGQQSDFAEKRMFGGLTFMVRGHMCCGVVGTEIVVRVGPQAYARALSAPHAREMTFTGRPLTGMVYVGSAGLETDKALGAWIARGLAFVGSLPVRSPKPRAAKSPRVTRTVRSVR
jgi:hypothetical protein